MTTTPTSAMSDLKDSGALLRQAYQAMQDLDINTEEVFRRSRISIKDLYNSNLRTYHRDQERFWQVLESVSEDKNIGLILGEKIPIFKGLVLEYLFISAANYGDGLRCILQYQRLISDAITVELSLKDNQAYLSLNYQNSDSKQLLDCTLMAASRALQDSSNRELLVERVELSHDGLGDHSLYSRLFNCPVLFGQADNRIYFSPELLTQRSIHSQPELLSLQLQCADTQLAQLHRHDFIARVRGNIASQLASGDATIATVAENMDIDSLQLKDQLENAQTSFSQILNQYRHQLSIRLLEQTSETIAEIVYLTGFAEPSTFYRAFKRWEGVTPIEYRRRQQGLAALSPQHTLTTDTYNIAANHG